MPADIVTLEDCASNYGVFKVKGKTGNYVVTLGGSEGPAHCTCKAYMYSPEDDKQCKHIKEVWEQACLYNAQWRDAKKCPSMRPVEYTYDAFSGNKCECGGPLVWVRRAV